MSIFATPDSAHAYASDALAANVEITPERVTWHPRLDAEQILLTVTGPKGIELRRAFEAETLPSLPYAAIFPDGTYRYEITLLTAPKQPILEQSEGRRMRRIVQTGTFLVQEEAMLPPVDAAHAQRDEVISDNVIITGGLCVGQDCANGEAFTFVSMKLKENNLRLYFDDTSNSASFPDNDWQITINSTSNGGGSYFGVDDITNGRQPFRIEAGAPEFALYVESSGDIGGGTDNPDEALHLLSATKRPGIKLEHTGTSDVTLFTTNNGLQMNRDFTSTDVPLRIHDTDAGIGAADLLRLDGNGNLTVFGAFEKASGSFVIDHPLDPENKYLYHSFVESPDMMNVYNGNVTTDTAGFATVTLPDYFEALNKDFRYQLTVIGTFARAIIAEEIKDNQFVIRTNEPKVKVSWQVTGIRHDPWAEANRIQVEVDKPETERGTYLHPQVYQQQK